MDFGHRGLVHHHQVQAKYVKLALAHRVLACLIITFLKKIAKYNIFVFYKEKKIISSSCFNRCWSSSAYFIPKSIN